jgi:PhnB protein
MTVVLNPYIGFHNEARAAMEFYRDVFGGELLISTFADFHASVEPSEQDLVMHSVLKTPGDLTLMGSDTPSHMEYKPGTNISISLSGDDEAALRGYYDKLADGGTVNQPLEKAAWGDSFGMCTDKFGITWLVNISGAPS